MGFLDKLLKNRERTRLEEAIRKEPSAAAFLRLARVLQEEGDLAQARATAKRGTAAFPQDAELVQLERDLTVLERETECRRLREQIANYPNGRLYAHLAELYRSGGEEDKAFQVARSGLAGFPDHDGLHYVMGQLQLARGATEEARRHLARATELDKFNYSALKLLGQLLTDQRRYTEAADVYARIRSFAPDDEEVKGLHGRAAQAGGVKVEPPRARPAAARTAAPPVTPFWSRSRPFRPPLRFRLRLRLRPATPRAAASWP